MSYPTDPDELIAGYEQQLAAAEQKATRIREELDGVQITERSPSGATVTVNATGNPQNIEVSDELAARGGRAVTSEIMRALSAAQAKVAGRVEQAMQPYLGGTEAMERTIAGVRSAHPVPGDGPARQAPQETYRFNDEPDETPPPPAKPNPPRPRPRGDNDDDDFGGPIMRGGKF